MTQKVVFQPVSLTISNYQGTRWLKNPERFYWAWLCLEESGVMVGLHQWESIQRFLLPPCPCVTWASGKSFNEDRSWIEKMSSCNCMLLRRNEKMVVKYLIDKLLALALDLALTELLGINFAVFSRGFINVVVLKLHW